MLLNIFNLLSRKNNEIYSIRRRVRIKAVKTDFLSLCKIALYVQICKTKRVIRFKKKKRRKI